MVSTESWAQILILSYDLLSKSLKSTMTRHIYVQVPQTKSDLLLFTGSCFSEIIAPMRGPCLSSAKVNSPVVDKVNIIWAIK